MLGRGMCVRQSRCGEVWLEGIWAMCRAVVVVARRCGSSEGVGGEGYRFVMGSLERWALGD